MSLQIHIFIKTNLVLSARQNETHLKKQLGVEVLTRSEKENANLVKKFLVAKNYIKKGERFTLENLTAKRTGGGIESMKIGSVLNKKSKINFFKNEIIKI